MVDASPLSDLETAALNLLIQPARLAQLGMSSEAYEMDVFVKSRCLSELVAELEYVINAITRANTFTDARLLLKFYVVTWVSLSDILGALINEVFQLGYASHDVSFQVILRNQHVATSRLPEVFTAHRPNLEFDRYARARNELVHRGDFEDSQLDAVQREWHLEVVKALRGVDPSDRVAIEAGFQRARDLTNLTGKAAELLAEKQTHLRRHVTATRQFLEDIAAELLVQLNKRCP